MPIRPSQRALYPADWKAISQRIRFDRAEGRCECTGQCDDQHPGGRCSAPHDTHIIRHNDTPALWRTVEDLVDSLHAVGDLGVGYGNDRKPVRVVLTTAHLDHDPRNVADVNLLACCQRCHLRIDRFEHARNAAVTVQRKREAQAREAGQVGLFATTEGGGQ